MGCGPSGPHTGGTSMATTTAINTMTGAVETVQVNGYGRVPAGYRVPTDGERAKGRGDALRAEATTLRARGDVVGAEAAGRTLADGIATGVCR